MRLIVISVFFVALLSSIHPLLDQHEDTRMLILHQSESPAILTQATHTSSDLLSSAKLENVSTSSIASYRIGWIAVFRSGKTRSDAGIEWSAVVAPGQVVEVPAQAVNPRIAEGATVVAFYVREVQWASGKTWKADSKRVVQEARNEMR